jgi:hypothetical protein
MSGSLKLGLYILLAVIVGWFAIKLAVGIFFTFLPLLIMVAIGLVIVGAISRKALGGSRRTLP